MCNTASPAPDSTPPAAATASRPVTATPSPDAAGGHPDREADPDGLTPATRSLPCPRYKYRSHGQQVPFSRRISRAPWSSSRADLGDEEIKTAIERLRHRQLRLGLRPLPSTSSGARSRSACTPGGSLPLPLSASWSVRISSSERVGLVRPQRRPSGRSGSACTPGGNAGSVHSYSGA